ncbi:hypothetical protein KRX57_07450 [Weeksellaceae bacterium TAE3-ERU29]|nr:hypothetical protein [Weeksellaceae bacterium TAE3-ERU29]
MVFCSRAPWCEKDNANPFDSAVKGNPLIPFCIVKKNSIVFKTADGKFGKLEMQSLYKGTPPNPLPAYYDQYYLTFRYVIQENGKNELDIPIDVE